MLSRRTLLKSLPLLAGGLLLALRQPDSAEARECCESPDLLALGSSAAATSQDARIFGLPFATPAGPKTWLLGQPYGNTTGAYRQRRRTYGSGQGIHFGIDLTCP